MQTYLEFEKPIIDLESKIEELRHLDQSDGNEIDIEEEVQRLRQKSDKLMRQTYEKLTPAQKVQVARHPNRPHALDYIDGLITDYQPLAGDRFFAEDSAIVGGLGRFNGRSVMVIGQEKGRDTDARIKHNFGMAKPEGYRKAIRLMEMAARFGLPVITLVDTAGAYPGVASEERGQAEAIARAIEVCLGIETPLVSVVIGEGGSGGAIALASANKILMLEHSIYSVISPEGCASILWRSGEQWKEAATALKLTATDLSGLGIIDTVVEEPVGGAHRHREHVIKEVGAQLEAALRTLEEQDGPALKAARRGKFIEMGRAGLA